MTQTAMPGLVGSDRFRGWLTAARRFCFGSLAGWLMVAGAALKAGTLGLSSAGFGGASGVQGLSTLGGIALVIGAGILLVRVARKTRTQLLWRVRRKLIISYLFIGVVPAILIVTFFALSGLLLFANLSSFLIRSSLTDLADEAMSVARIAAVEIEAREGAPAIREALERRAAAARAEFPGISLAVVPVPPSRCPQPDVARGASGPTRVTAGGWQHGPAPGFLPAWIPCAGFAGVLAQPPAARGGTDGGAEIVVRAVAFAERHPWTVVVVDVPVAGAVKARIEAATGIVIGPASAVALTPLPVQGQAAVPAAAQWRARTLPGGGGGFRGWPCWITSTGPRAARSR